MVLLYQQLGAASLLGSILLLLMLPIQVCNLIPAIPWLGLNLFWDRLHVIMPYLFSFNISIFVVSISMLILAKSYYILTCHMKSFSIIFISQGSYVMPSITSKSFPLILMLWKLPIWFKSEGMDLGKIEMSGYHHLLFYLNSMMKYMVFSPQLISCIILLPHAC